MFFLKLLQDSKLMKIEDFTYLILCLSTEYSFSISLNHFLVFQITLVKFRTSSENCSSKSKYMSTFNIPVGVL